MNQLYSGRRQLEAVRCARPRRPGAEDCGVCGEQAGTDAGSACAGNASSGRKSPTHLL